MAVNEAALAAFAEKSRVRNLAAASPREHTRAEPGHHPGSQRDRKTCLPICMKKAAEFAEVVELDPMLLRRR